MLGLLDRVNLRDDEARAGVEGEADGGVVVAGDSGGRGGSAMGGDEWQMEAYLTKGMVRPPLMNITSWTIYFSQKKNSKPCWDEGNHGSHRLNVTRRVLPVNPHHVEAHRGQVPRDGHRAEAGIVPDQRRDFLLVGIADGLARKVRLEERRRRVLLHALRRLDEVVIDGG